VVRGKSDGGLESRKVGALWAGWGGFKRAVEGWFGRRPEIERTVWGQGWVRAGGFNNSLRYRLVIGDLCY
jgi:hypothetical protein